MKVGTAGPSAADLPSVRFTSNPAAISQVKRAMVQLETVVTASAFTVPELGRAGGAARSQSHDHRSRVIS